MVDSATGELTEYLIDSVPATPGFFEALGIRLVRGRLPTEADTSMSQPVILIDTEMERRFFGDRDPIGTTLPLGLEIVDGRRADVTIVGIVGDVKYLGLDQASGTTIYFPFSQWPIESAFLVARTDGDAAAALPVIRSVIRTVDSRIVVDISQTLDGLVAEQTVQPRVRALVLLVLAGLALALAAVGLYGVVAYWVAQRTTEIGVRMALGATPPAVLSMVMREGVQLVAIGGALGTMAAIALTRALGTLLYGISPTDPVSFAAALLCLTIVTLVASYLPARRATCIDPVAALRDE
jgi:predicted permease